MREQFERGKIIEWSYRSNSGLISETGTGSFGESWFRFRGCHVDNDYFESRNVKAGDSVWFTWVHIPNGRYLATLVLPASDDPLDNPNLEKDPLGVLVDHRHLSQLIREYGVHVKPGSLLALMRIDLDGFKSVNDNFGHSVGDALLRAVFDEIRSICSKNKAIPIRAGGDEVVVLAHKSTLQEAGTLAESIRFGVQSAVISVNNKSVGVTASIGVSSCPPTVLEDLDKVADNAAIGAKGAGKNRVVIA